MDGSFVKRKNNAESAQPSHVGRGWGWRSLREEGNLSEDTGDTEVIELCRARQDRGQLVKEPLIGKPARNSSPALKMPGNM